MLADERQAEDDSYFCFETVNGHIAVNCCTEKI